jgi:hypothetical protein
MIEAEDEPTSVENPPLTRIPSDDLLREIARRLRLRFGRMEISFHDGRPAPKIVVEYRIERAFEDLIPPTRTTGRPIIAAEQTGNRTLPLGPPNGTIRSGSKRP